MQHQSKFQSFAETTDPAQGAPRLAALRQELKRRGLDGFIVPRSDEYQGEYVPARAERLAWLTGFTGSAGACVVLLGKAAVFVDGRYTVQAPAQIDTKAFAIESLTDLPPPDWIAKNLPAGAKLGYDPWLHSVSSAGQLAEAVARADAELVAVHSNPLDAIWADQPVAPLGLVSAQPLVYAGEDARSKCQKIGNSLREASQDAAILTMPESIAWLLNIRGDDVPHTPFPHSYACVESSGHVTLFVDRRKLTPAIDAWLGNMVTVLPPDQLGLFLDSLGQSGKRVRIDPTTSAAWIGTRLKQSKAKVSHGTDPCMLPKACKNPVEVQGIRNAHVRDGAAVSRFLAWVSKAALSEHIDEISAAKKLEAFRLETGALKDLSFGSISASGPNAALPHYRVTTRTNRRLMAGEIYLIDSGGQYLDGTTDITRTIIIGNPSAEMKDRFTRVLKGHIALAMARFPEGTAGVQLDILARQALWEGGFDYDHGTGHGVGAYLSVHEGPQNISKRAHGQALKPGMVCSNEPGYYKVGHYGIRTENLIVVSQGQPLPGGERPMMSFETVTLAPIDRALIDPGLLSGSERDWLNAYHARVEAVLSPLVDEGTRAWLKTSCLPV